MRLCKLFIFLLIPVLSFLIPRYALADSPATWEGEIDGVPVWITVVPGEHEISARVRERQPWWEWGNTTTDTYLFAFERPDNVRLILEFTTQANGSPQAKIYVNQGTNEPLDYSLEDGSVQVHTSQGHPYLVMRSHRGGWFDEGQVNYRLSFSINGRLPDSEFGPPGAQTDGKIDIVSQVGGEQPGIPEWQTMYLAHDPNPDRDYRRFTAWQRMSDAPPFKVAPPLMPGFPYLGIGARNIDWFSENRNPLYFNLDQSLLQLFPFPGFQNSGIYHINSSTLPPEVSFEAPFAFYSFDATTRYAHLLIRSVHHPAEDPFTSNRTFKNAFSSFRYSWKTEDEERWSYSLHLAGSYVYSQPVKIGETEFWGVPANQLPDWVASKPWPMTTFVEAVEGYPGGEGIYFYSTQTTDTWPWLYGANGHPPTYLAEPYLQQTTELTSTSVMGLPVGFRGEYNAAYFRQPKLYFSPIDNRLHLLYAQGGVWNLGNDRILRVHNLKGGAYMDGWTRERVPPQEEGSEQQRALSGEVEEAIYAFEGYLLYSGTQETELRQVANPPSRFEILPPKDKESWLEFRNRIALYSDQERDPMDLKGWLGAFSGQTLSISKGQILGVRAMEGGFRFILDLQPGFHFHGDNLLDVLFLTPGQYAVTFDGKFTIEPLTPPSLSASLIDTTLTRLEPGALHIALRNDGGEDLPQATLELWAALPEEEAAVVTTQTVSLLARAPITPTIQWAPPLDGEWTLTTKIRWPDGRLSTFAPTPVIVLPAKPAEPEVVIALSSSPETLPLTVLGLMTFAALAALVFWRQLQRFPME